ncbi:ent-kaurenoic acid oxidase 1-like [Diospyros lotus]|uniref:ent-kaurenoic acid oxidase 1-like n=1 Tax=Diospyros lotus TaxID=55363 RepID=UPI00224CAABF|nr:ent-kaurenoic acid oxidase 1-like [Diospyros lotus]
MEGLMQLTDEEGKRLSDKEVVDNIVSLVIAGYMSTSFAMMWALYYLAKDPNVLQKLREENIHISQEKNDKLITSDDISNMKDTNKVKIPKGWKAPARAGTHLVFGGGLRLCAGNMLAKLQLSPFFFITWLWELVNPNAKMTYLAHPKPVDGVEITFGRTDKAK